MPLRGVIVQALVILLIIAVLSMIAHFAAMEQSKEESNAQPVRLEMGSP